MSTLHSLCFNCNNHLEVIIPSMNVRWSVLSIVDEYFNSINQINKWHISASLQRYLIGYILAIDNYIIFLSMVQKAIMFK
mgnify:CR=1 FL=1